MRSFFVSAALLCGFAPAVVLVPAAWAAGPTQAPDGARAYFISPQDGETISSPVTVRFGLTGMGVAPSGVDKPNTGHHHLLIDTDLPGGEDLDFSLPADATHVHFGGGQTETQVELSPGTHTLQLLLGDKDHIPHARPVASEKITVTVE